MAINERNLLSSSIRAAEKYLTNKGYKVISLGNPDDYVHIVAMTPDDVLAFIRVQAEVEFMPGELFIPLLRGVLEDFAVEWINEHTEYFNVEVRFDCISFQVNDNETGLLRHHIDVMNPEPDVLVAELKSAREIIRAQLATIESLTADSANPDAGTLEAELKAARETIRAMAASNDAMQQRIDNLEAELAFKDCTVA